MEIIIGCITHWLVVLGTLLTSNLSPKYRSFVEEVRRGRVRYVYLYSEHRWRAR